MKTFFTKSAFILSTLFISSCTNSADKPNVISIREEIIQTTPMPSPPSTNNELVNTTWTLIDLNGEDMIEFDATSNPYMIFSFDSLFVLGNTGCNDFIGECIIQDNNTIDIHNIKNKEQYYPANALERELIYSLDISDRYWIKNDTLVLYHQNTPIGIFVAK